MSDDKEKVYDEKIAPLMQQVQRLCLQNGLAMFAMVDLGEGDDQGHRAAAILHQPLPDHTSPFGVFMCIAHGVKDPKDLPGEAVAVRPKEGELN